MHPEMETLRCSIVRGGTSKGIFIMKNALPDDPAQRDAVILAIFGSPDIRQIDGLGGADVLTSKLAIISPSTRPDADVDYTFGQVSFEKSFIDYKGNCGNISSAVGGFAIDEGLVTPQEPVTKVRIHLTNSHHILVAEVPVKGGQAAVEGDFAIDGCPDTGARITLDWAGTQGAITGKMLPTGRVIDEIRLADEVYPISIVDVANPVVFIRAESLGLTGLETPAQIESDRALMNRIEEIRGRAAQMIGLVDEPSAAATASPYIPFFAIISSPKDHQTFTGQNIGQGEVDIVSRLLFMLRMHKAYPITGTVCTGAAARIAGTVVWEAMNAEARDRVNLRIGHPSGVIPIEAEAEAGEQGTVRLTRAAVYRTARKIMDGQVYVRKSVWNR